MTARVFIRRHSLGADSCEMAGTSPKAWLDLPFTDLTKENVRAEAAARGLTFRELMRLYYQQDSRRATNLALFWDVTPDCPKQLFGGARAGLFVGDLREFLVESGVRLTVVEGEDTQGLDQLQALKEDRRVRELQEQRPQQGPGASKPRKRKRGGNRKAKDARRRARQVRTIPPEALPPPRDSLRYNDGDGNVLRFNHDGMRLERTAKPPAKRARRRARRSSSSSSSSSSAYFSSSSSSLSSPSSFSLSSLFSSSSSSSSSGSSSSSEADSLPRARPPAPGKVGGGAVPAAEAASPPPEVEVLYTKPPERVSEDRWVAAFRRAQPAEKEEEA